jgi:hypothetical protein
MQGKLKCKIHKTAQRLLMLYGVEHEINRKEERSDKENGDANVEMDPWGFDEGQNAKRDQKKIWGGKQCREGEGSKVEIACTRNKMR